MDVRLAEVQARIADACGRAGRAVEGVRLIGVTKYQSDEAVRAVVAAGLADLGENHPQALARRLATFGAPLRWHAIGPLQTNKARHLDAAAAFHALDRPRVAEVLARRRGAGDPLECFVQVNITGEDTKHGVAPGDASALVDAASALPGLRVVGLMCMPPYTTDAETSRPHFATLRELAGRIGLPRLSMGTTGDFEVAVEEGATDVRVGRALYGE